MKYIISINVQNDASVYHITVFNNLLIIKINSWEQAGGSGSFKLLLLQLRLHSVEARVCKLFIAVTNAGSRRMKESRMELLTTGWQTNRNLQAKSKTLNK